ncbi:hypothetical protein [Absiella sp. AM29-15]|uniref:hypothetical protein n=1 Tax=Absiella sp. AM29-15 TaxID=2292278 RepID=UPI000E4167F3|nr:hypothetical protein [Absiella sp. AM29-15]RGC52871.1 hypothetical protein DW761_04280 [Absiella sp. AM29-15]
MKKSTLLSFVTAGAIVATSVGTYAAWDQTSGQTDTKQLTFTKPVIVEVTKDMAGFTTNELNGNSNKSSTGTVSLKSNDATKTIELSLVDADGNPLAVPEGLNVNFSTSDTSQNGTVVDNGDGTASVTGYTVDTNLTYDVKIEVKDEVTPDQATNLSNTPLNFAVKATLTNTPDAA